ncbi:uracil-DNA glycosylase [Patescibacteria group bacterium]|nr:uracil-DNA glycosylase [Patescibacteria group bacterium]
MKNKDELLKAIRDEVLDAKNSPLYAERKKNKVFPVIGEGDCNSKIMFIGEAPGRKEAESGRPFCGASGKVLDKLLNHIGMNRKDVYITNLVKDRPPENRDPSSEDIDFYAPFLDRQIEIIQPKIIATLGRISMRYIMEKFNLLPKFDTIGKIHGSVFEVKSSYSIVKIVPLFHPATAIYNASKMPLLQKDFELLSIRNNE